MSFAEHSSGTNAIAISINSKKTVYTLAKHHYCDFLRKTNFYCTPLWTGEKILAYLAVTTTEQTIKKELIAITELLAYQLTNEFKKSESKKTSDFQNSYLTLSNKQLAVLKFLARGLTDKATGIEMGLSFDTIKFHKKNIFRKLSAKCTLEAVVKALKLNLISIDEINF